MRKLSVWWVCFDVSGLCWLLALRPKQVEEFERIIDKTCDSSCELFTLLVALLTVFLQSKASFRSFLPRVSRGKVEVTKWLRHRTSDLSPRWLGANEHPWHTRVRKPRSCLQLQIISKKIQKYLIPNILYTLYVWRLSEYPQNISKYIIRHRGLVGTAEWSLGALRFGSSGQCPCGKSLMRAATRMPDVDTWEKWYICLVSDPSVIHLSCFVAFQVFHVFHVIMLCDVMWCLVHVVVRPQFYNLLTYLMTDRSKMSYLFCFSWDLIPCKTW